MDLKKRLNPLDMKIWLIFLRITFTNKKLNENIFVYCYKSLLLNQNKNIPKDRRMRKLLSSVKDNENDYINYPKNRYFRKYEMCSYFGDLWEIIIFKESNLNTFDKLHPFNNKEHIYLVGHIFVRKNIKEENINITITYQL